MIITADKNRSDGVYFKVCEMLKIKIPILLISRSEVLDLNTKIYELENIPFIVIDVIENGWNDTSKDTLIVGENTSEFFNSSGWLLLHDFLKENKPVLYFKRELKKKDATDTILPCEYPNWQERYPLQLKEEFNNRPISVFNYWGRSHEARLILHGEIWKNAARKGYTVCDNVYQFNNFMHDEKNNPNKWVSFHLPHYSRIDISELMKINAMSKLSVSMPGCGIKCFRSTGESLVNSVLVLPEDDLAYSYPLEHGINCIKFSINEDVTGLKNEWSITEAIETALQRNDLYDIYLNGYKAAEFYRIENYISYLENIINNA